MTPTELHALADALESKQQGVFTDAWKKAAAYLRECAEEEPVAHMQLKPRTDAVPLYTHPAPAQPASEPLTDFEINTLINDHFLSSGNATTGGMVLRFARAVLAAQEKK
jgi:hypothetical protein